MVDKVIASLSDKYGKVGDMTMKQGKIHDCLGMALDFAKEGKCIVNMEEYIDKILTGLPEDMNGVATTPVADHMFKTHSDTSKLSKEKANLFNLVTA